MKNVSIVWGKSDGETLVSAFDKALAKAGIHNFNLVPLSSIIPPNVKVIEVGRYDSSKRNTGDIVYVVISSHSCDKIGTQISTGLAWVQAKEGGLIIESNGQFDISTCRKELEIGLKEMMSTRDWDWNTNIRRKVLSHTVKRVGSIVIAAVYDF